MKVGIKDITNPLELLECIIAFDSRDWADDKRDRMIYAIVFGWDDECCESFGWDKDTIAEYKKMHERFEELKQVKFEGTVKEMVGDETIDKPCWMKFLADVRKALAGLDKTEYSD